MSRLNELRWGLGSRMIAVACGLSLAGSARAQSFFDLKVPIPSGAPGNLSFSENVDFADIDLDGDWDAAFANGGECCNEQNRIWVNQGGQQGGLLAFFEDETAARAPLVADGSNDVEFADWDADGDADLFISNTSDVVNQSSRFWTNVGGAQAGTAGFFVDETSERWVDLGGPGSSISPSVVIPTGGFIDWSSDADFADLDNDGDLDLVHSSYGAIFGGQTPTRLFLNDGTGSFSEFNPSGTTLNLTTITPGLPAIWCEGAQASDTTDTTGLFADVALSALDVELGDIDGDLDLDIVHGDLIAQPRVFRNRLSETGQLRFRDITHLALTELTPETGNYDQELADLDGDLDLDLYCLGWLEWGNGVSLNDGSGVFGGLTEAPNTDKRQIEATLFDYDNDGDLDAYAVGVTVEGDRLFANDGAGGLTDVSDLELPVTADERSRGSDVADVNGDGDWDLFIATEDRNQYLMNVTNVADVTAPSLTRLEAAPDRVAGPAPTVVRVQVFDNAPLRRLKSYAVWLEISIDAGPSLDVPMMSSGAGLFRGEIPGHFAGQIQYRAMARDGAGNVGASLPATFMASLGAQSSQNTTYCTSKTNSLGCVPRAQLLGLCSVSSDSPCWFVADQILNGRNGLWFYGFGSFGVPFLGGTLCVQPPLRRTVLQNSGGNPPPGDCSGRFAADINAWIDGGLDAQLVPGQGVYAQWWYRDSIDPVGTGLTDAISFVVQP